MFSVYSTSSEEQNNAVILKNNCIPILIPYVKAAFYILGFESHFYTSTCGAICDQFMQQFIFLNLNCAKD
jgi:hypothetical protein